MASDQNVMVFGEVHNDKLTAMTAELLGCGRQLADQLSCQVEAVLIGHDTRPAVREMIDKGADHVYFLDHEAAKVYRNDIYLDVLARVAEKAKPVIMLFGQNSIGRDLVPRLAFRLGSAAAMDCIELSIDPDTGRLLQTRPVAGGNARAVYVTSTDPQIVTVRSKTMQPAESDPSRNGELIELVLEMDPGSSAVTFIREIPEISEGIKLEDADVVIGGGRGLGGPEGFSELEKLANLLKGAVGASRPPCDNEWMPNSRLIGLTGKIIIPDLYIAVAISGASQHMSGCGMAKTIVAINKDPEASIFKDAHFGVIGDWKKILPAFTSKVKELVEA